jgi:DNA recombination protein RmuC
MLRTIAYAWRQEALARNALEVHSLARELYSRLSTMGDHVGKLGSSLSGAVTAYNKAVGSLEARVLVSARKLAELGVSHEDLVAPAQIEIAPRQPSSPELVGLEESGPAFLTAGIKLDPQPRPLSGAGALEEERT